MQVTTSNNGTPMGYIAIWICVSTDDNTSFTFLTEVIQTDPPPPALPVLLISVASAGSHSSKNSAVGSKYHRHLMDARYQDRSSPESSARPDPKIPTSAETRRSGLRDCERSPSISNTEGSATSSERPTDDRTRSSSGVKIPGPCPQFDKLAINRSPTQLRSYSVKPPNILMRPITGRINPGRVSRAPLSLI